MQPGATDHTIVPNDVVRRVRRHYLALLSASLALGFATFLLAGNGLLAPIAALLLLSGALALLVMAILVLQSGICPRCKASLLLKKNARLTGSRIALLTKAQCPSCGLDLDRPYVLMGEAKDQATSITEPP